MPKVTLGHTGLEDDLARLLALWSGRITRAEWDAASKTVADDYLPPADDAHAAETVAGELGRIAGGAA